MKGAKGKWPAKRGALSPVHQRKVGKKKALAKDPNKPRRPTTAFFVFMEEFRRTFKRENPCVKAVSVYGKAGGEKWRSMSATERAPYEVNAARRKTKYDQLMKAYKKKKQEYQVDDVEDDSDRPTSEVGDESVQLLNDDNDLEIFDLKQKRNMKGAKGKRLATRDALKAGYDRKVGKKNVRAKDPNKPKRPACAFFVFMEKFRVKFKRENPHVKNVSAYTKAGGKKWRSMSEAEKAPYEANAAKRKTEYLKLIKAYNKKKQERETDDGEEASNKSISEEDSYKSTFEEDSDKSTSEEDSYKSTFEEASNKSISKEDSYKSTFEEDSDKSTSNVDEESVQMMENTSNQSAQFTIKPSSLPMETIAQKPRLSNVNAFEKERDQTFPVQGFGKPHQQEHMPFIQSCVSNYGNSGGNYSSPNMNMSSQTFKQQTHALTSSSGLQRSSSQPSIHKDQSLMSCTIYVKKEPSDQRNDPQLNYQMLAPQGSSSIPLFESEETTGMMSSKPGFSTSMSVTAQLESQNVSAGNNVKTPQQKPTVGQKKTSEALVSSLSLSKKQKVSGAISDQIIEQLNDVPVVSEVNLREREVDDVQEISDKSTFKAGGESVQMMENASNQSAQITSTKPSSLPMHKDQSLMSSTACVKQEPLDQMNGPQHNHQMLPPQGPEKTPQQKPTVGQKKPSEALVSSLSKKQKVSGAISDQSIEQLNDVPAVSGVNLREREVDDVQENSDKSTFEAGGESLQMMENTSNQSAQLTSTKPSSLPMHKDQSLLSSTACVKQEPLDQMNDPAHNYQMLPPQGPSSICLKIPEALVTSQSKKQKVCGAFSDQSIEQLTDTTVVSGVNHKGEEEQLFYGSKEDSQLSETSRKTVHEEEERLILQETHMEKCGVKNQSSDMETPLSLVERSPSPQNDTICIRGYKVQRSNATILESIFKKHGDIVADCILKTHSARTYQLELICEVVRQIQTKDLIEMGEYIECLVSDAEAININVSWIRAHFDAIHKSRKTDENHTLLMKMQENMMLVIQAAKKCRTKRSLELFAAEERLKTSDKCVRVLHLSERNLDDNILKSKEKLDSWVKHSLV